jgi:hypothetical protein
MKPYKHFCMHLECDSIIFITAANVVQRNSGERQHIHNTLMQDVWVSSYQHADPS